VVDKKVDNTYGWKITQPVIALMTIDTPNTPWYIRLFYIIKIPYDILRYIITGRAYFGWGS